MFDNSKSQIKYTVYRAVNGRPSENILNVINPNLSALKVFVDLILNAHNGRFNGELFVAENCHRGTCPGEALNSGWVPVFSRNSDLDQTDNYNDLGKHLKKKYGDKFSICHWIEIDKGGKRVFSPVK